MLSAAGDYSDDIEQVIIADIFRDTSRDLNIVQASSFERSVCRMQAFTSRYDMLTRKGCEKTSNFYECLKCITCQNATRKTSFDTCKLNKNVL